jgi:hypothetical protein
MEDGFVLVPPPTAGPSAAVLPVFSRRSLWPGTAPAVHAAEDAQLLDDYEEAVGSALSHIFRNPIPPGYRYFSDVLHAEDVFGARALSRAFVKRAEATQHIFLLVAIHDDHVHTIHACPYSNRSCRCLLFRSYDRTILRRHATRRPLFSGISRQDWYRIVFYLWQGGRRIIYLQVGGRALRVFSGHQDLSASGDFWSNPQGLVAACGMPAEDGVQPDGLTPGNDESGSRVRRDIGEAGRRSDRASKQIEEIILKSPCVPLSNIVRTEDWLSNKLLCNMRDDNNLVKSVIDAWCCRICRYTFNDFYELYSAQNCKPLFHAGNMPVNVVYYDIDTSLEIINELLKFQFDSDAIQVTRFLQSVYDVMERKIPKLNTILTCSPPSAGKNYFFDMWLDFYMNVGQLGNPNRHNRFAYQEAINKRVLLWNEPNYEAKEIDTLKMLLGGDSLTVQIKCKPDAAVTRTPVIILTNNNIPLMTDPAFHDRILCYTWKSAPFLKDATKKPNPMCLKQLLTSWNILFE